MKVDGRHSDTKERLFMIALDLFAEKGVEATSIRDIVKEAGISTAAFYNHFSSKDALLQAVYDHYQAVQAVAGPMSSEGVASLLERLGPVDYLLRLIGLSRGAMDDPVLDKLGRIIALEKGRNPTAAEISRRDCERLLSIMEESFAAMQGSGYLKGKDARVVGRTIGYVLLGLFDENVYWRYVKKESVDKIAARLEARLRPILEQLIGG